MLVNIAVENFDGSQTLHQIDKSKTLEENIRSVCQIFRQPFGSATYGLKLKSTNDGKVINTYISEDNFDEIKDGYFLQLAYSLGYYLNRIFEHMTDVFKEQSFEDLYNLSFDTEFIKEMVKTNRHLILIDHFTSTSLQNLEQKELTACLVTIAHLFLKGHIADISSEFLSKVISVVKAGDSPNEQIKFALSIIHKILCHRDESFSVWKEEIIERLPFDEITPFIWSEDFKDLQYGALLLINTIIKCCKGDKRQHLIKEITMRKNKEKIYKHIILTGNVDKNIAHELYVYQTYILSLFVEALNTEINLNDTKLFNRKEFENDSRGDAKTSSLLMDFDEDNMPKSRNASIENLTNADDNARISLASISSKQSMDTLRSSSRNPSLVIDSLVEFDTSKISVLTIEALRHYKSYHAKNFYQSQIEERVYGPGILQTAERIIRVLAKILHVGREPDRTTTTYQPTLFNAPQNMPFLLELFSRTMWLLSKTRREMKASTLEDYSKVIYVLNKQIKLILEEKPMSFKALTDAMMTVSYETVVEHWQKEKEAEMDNVIKTHPAVKVLKQMYVEDNKVVVFNQRMAYLVKGAVFPKFSEKKIIGYFLAKLSENQRQLIVHDFDPKSNKFLGNQEMHPISDITHVIEGKACPHVINNTVKEHHLAFSIIINHTTYINFKAKDKKMASYWTDAFNLLLGKPNRSASYQDELNQLVKMDLLLHLIELQNVRIPKKPPPVPPPPFDQKLRPPIPPKPQFLNS